LNKIKLALCTHNHQPVGNFDFVFEDGYHKAYLPLLELLEKHPKIKIAQHYTGILFEWILERYPDFVKTLRNLVERGQVEMMTGGFYEPILINIPDRDKLGQIRKLSDFVKDHTGYDPTGMWLAERIWEPQLPSALSNADIKYTVVDDSHFKTAGLSEGDLFGYYNTEDTGHVIKIFPISEKLRYTIPFQEPEATIDYLRSVATEDEDRLVVFADDGEKFGIWPGTYEHCYQNMWLERFFTALEDNLDWIELVHFTEAIEKLPPQGNVYLPTASYREMMEWALPSKAIHEYEEFESQLKQSFLFDRYKVFVRGGFWRNFLAKYPESNNMHKKSLYVSEKIRKLAEQKGIRNKSLEQAQDNLWAGQCNCPYWHGVFGGLYLNNIRSAVYSHMIKAETLADDIKAKKEKRDAWIDSKVFDFDADGHDELVVETRDWNLYFAPHRGGSIFEMDYKPKSFNLLDTMSRREEGYHRKLLELASGHQQNEDGGDVASIHDKITAKEENLHEHLHYDWYRRCSLIDHFLSPGTDIQSFKSNKYGEAGDFVTGAYSCETKAAKDTLNIVLARSGVVKDGDRDNKVELIKKVSINARRSNVKYVYTVKNQEAEPIELWFGIEFNYSLLAGHAPDRYYHFENITLDDPDLASTGAVSNVRKAGLKDEWMGIDIQMIFDKPADIWRFPIETISQSEGGFERVYQSSVLLPHWKVNIPAGGEWEIKIMQEILE